MVEVQAALTAITSAHEFAKYVINRKVDAAVTQKAMELTDSIISLQEIILRLSSQNSLLLQEKKNIEDKLMQLEKWDATAAKYQLKEVVPGLFVYSYERNIDSTTPSHWICTHCYELRKKSILQRKAQDLEGTIYECPSCRASFIDH